MPYANQVLPGSNSYPAATVPGNSYPQMPAPRMPRMSTYDSHYQDSPLATDVEYSWNSSFNIPYKEAKLGTAGLTDRWYCEMCNIDLPSDSAWQLVRYT